MRAKQIPTYCSSFDQPQSSGKKVNVVGLILSRRTGLPWIRLGFGQGTIDILRQQTSKWWGQKNSTFADFHGITSQYSYSRVQKSIENWSVWAEMALGEVGLSLP